MFPNKNNEYNYSKVDCLENKNMYMYSTHEWGGFLDIYIQDRNLALTKIKNKGEINFQEKNIPSIDSKNFALNIEELIDNIFIINTNKEKLEDYISFFVRRFEVSKRICRSYKKELDNKVEITDEHYIKLSYIFSKYLENNLNIKFLNCLLKINDKIIFKTQNWLGTEAELYAYHAISQELKIINSLLRGEFNENT